MNDNFCPAPWITISTDVNGSIRPCCRYQQPGRQTDYRMPWMKDGNLKDLYNSPKMQTLREAFLRGERPKECNWCWSEEAAGIESFRQKYRQRGYVYDTENPTPQILDLKLSNTCNLKCRMCGSTASSLIAKEQGVQESYWSSHKILGTKSEESFFNDILPGVKELELTGGEPFFSKENRDLLFRIIESGHAKNIKLLITTNGMVYNRKVAECLNEFKWTTLSVSVDDIGDRLSYARHGSRWETIKENIIKLRPTVDRLEVYRTINNYNVMYLNDLENECNAMGVKLNTGILHEPHWLSVAKLPEYVKEECRANMDPYHHAEVISHMFSEAGSVDHLLEFKRRTEALDEIRSESFHTVFPELAEVMMI